MSTLRRLACAGAFALPLSFVIVAPSSAGTLDGPYQPWSSESSSSFAGIGGAGTTDSAEGSDWWGHQWSEDNGTFAGIGGAGVYHNGHSEGGGWNGDDNDHGWSGHWTSDNDNDHVVLHHAVSHPDPVDDHVAYTKPVNHVVVDADDDDDYDNDNDADDAGYYHEAHTAGADGATSSHVASYAGDHYATYESGHLTAGPGGASSAGIHAVAVPHYAGYHNWYAAAGAGGTATHSVTSEATDNDCTDYDGDYNHDNDYDHHWTDNDHDYSYNG